MAIVKILTGHTSEETAFMQEDYPWGRRLRCRRRVWVESKEKKGQRFCAQTEDPRSGRWCKPKKSTYSDGGILIYLNEDDHVKQLHFSITWNNHTELEAFFEKYGEHFDEFQKNQMHFARAAAEVRKHITCEIVRGPETEEEKAKRKADNEKFQKDSQKLFMYEYQKIANS